LNLRSNEVRRGSGRDRPVQTEVIGRFGPWHGIEAVEFATLE
jgi:hypothetical protein